MGHSPASRAMTLTFRGSVLLALFLRTLCGLGRGAAPAGPAVQVHRHRVLRTDQRGVPVPAGSVPQVRVRMKRTAVTCFAFLRAAIHHLAHSEEYQSLFKLSIFFLI